MVTVRSIKSQDEFEALDAIYQPFFGSSSTPSIILKNRWLAYPNGLIGLYKDNLLIGGLSIWSINQLTYHVLEQGQIKESGINAESIDTRLRDRFYLSEIAIQEADRSRERLALLLLGFLEQLLTQSTFPVSILALGFSTKGINVLHKLGFRLLLPASQTADCMPLLQLDLPNHATITTIIHQLNRTLLLKS
jgi:hypothetical protein